MKFRHRLLGHTVTVKKDSADALRLARMSTWEAADGKDSRDDESAEAEPDA